jgi:K(+)-stimulated pyrophosphate-energized sodium pump
MPDAKTTRRALGSFVARLVMAATTLGLLLLPRLALASEADIQVPDLTNKQVSVTFLGLSGHNLLLWGLLICVLGLVFGFMMFAGLKKLPVHKSMRDISELIYETCKTYLFTQGKFIMLLWAFIGSIIFVYFGFLKPIGEGGEIWRNVLLILFFSLVGIGGSYSVAWFGIRINTFANSRSAFSGLKGMPYPTYAIPLKAGISIGTLLICIELVIMLIILLFVPGHLAGVCFIGFAIGESLGAAALRIAGGIFTKIADIGSDLMKIVFNIKEDDARNPGVIADCTGDNAGDSVGPTADGFETYGVTGVALITFILLAMTDKTMQVQLLVWIFVMRVMMIVTSIVSYWINGAVAKAKFGNASKFNFETPLTTLVWLTSIISVGVTYLVSYLLIPNLGNGLWWKLSTIITCGTLAGAIIPELVKVFTSTKSRHVQEIVTSSREGGASLGILSGFVAGNFSAYWMGMTILFLMGVAFIVSRLGLGDVMAAPQVFAFGLVAFGFLGMGPVTIAVDSYGPVTDNAQSVYELSTIETLPNIKEEIKKEFGFEPSFEKCKDYLEENDGAGNTFKATAKPVLIGTAVVGATTLIFSIMLLLAKSASGVDAHGATQLTLTQMNTMLQNAAFHFSLLKAPFLLGLIAGGAVIYWFTGASTQAVSTGAYRAVEFIKANIKLEGGGEKASIADSKKVVAICTQYAQKGMFNIFIVVFFSTLTFACLNSYFFIGYLVSIAIFGLYQAIFMADAGGGWDNAKKIVETELREKGTPLHAATVICDTVGDPFKDTSSVAMNPVIKFTTLFGVLAVELAITITNPNVKYGLAGTFFLISLIFVYRSFYNMRIKSDDVAEKPAAAKDKAA